MSARSKRQQAPHRRAKPRLSALEGRAAKRLSQIGALALLRDEAGEAFKDRQALGSWIFLVVDALMETSNCCVTEVRYRLPKASRGEVSDAEIDGMIAAAPHRAGRIVSNKRAGQMLQFRLAEFDEMACRGCWVFTFDPIDETPEARAARREARQREMHAESVRRARHEERAKIVTTEMSPPCGGGDKTCDGV